MTPVPTFATVVSPAELDQLRKRDQDMKILDVRTPGEFESAHIPGSYNVPLDQLAEHRYEIRAGVDTPIVVVCRSGMRARQAEQLLREADLTQLHVLDGGLAAWESAGLDIRKGRTRWSLERQVRAAAGALALLGGLGSLFVWRPLIAIPTFVGAGLLFAGVTDTCTMGRLLARLPYNRDATCDVASVVAELTGKPPTVRA